MLKRSNRACTFTKPLTVTEALQSLALKKNCCYASAEGGCSSNRAPPLDTPLYGENTQSVGLCIQYTDSTDSSPQNVLTCNIALGQEASYTVLGLAELRNVRDSAAPRSYVDSWSRAFSDSRAWLRKARSYIG